MAEITTWNKNGEKTVETFLSTASKVEIAAF